MYPQQQNSSLNSILIGFFILLVIAGVILAFIYGSKYKSSKSKKYGKDKKSGKSKKYGKDD